MWNDTQSLLLEAILDQLVPANIEKDVPGAGALGTAEFLLSATSYASDPVGAVLAILEGLNSKSEDFLDLSDTQKRTLLQVVEQEMPEDFATLVRLTYMGYYSRPDIRPLFGVGAHPIHPEGYAVLSESTALMDDLTAPVRARGPFFRDV